MGEAKRRRETDQECRFEVRQEHFHAADKALATAMVENISGDAMKTALSYASATTSIIATMLVEGFGQEGGRAVFDQIVERAFAGKIVRKEISDQKGTG